ncbi:MAG: formylglycine-generating enzyme family protein, partial [Thiomargarita sp.]|nr:formylglycine-generating enzyme family protein [Thiomargarita sp.]
MAILASFYLIQDIYLDLKKGASIESEELQKQIAELQNKLDNKTYSEPIRNEAIRNESIPDEPTVKETLSAGNVFRDRLQDGSSGPKIVVIPAGHFRMGDIQGGGSSGEKPVHRVSIEKFAMGKYEVTVGEYLRFVQATGTHAPEWQEKGSEYHIRTGTDNHYKKLGSALTNENHPIVGISWDDAVAYAEWLSQQTGKEYRLPTEAEWEYAARAGTDTKYWWGNKIGQNRANCDGCGSRWDNKQTAQVGSFSANPFGLYDTVGNVWEWTCSEYENEYSGALLQKSKT